MRRVVIMVEDDLGEGTAEETVEFGLDGVRYEIDLSAKNAENFRHILQLFIASARPVTDGSQFVRSRSQQGTGAVSSSEIRRWAQRNGYAVADQGRISELIRRAYLQANGH